MPTEAQEPRGAREIVLANVLADVGASALMGTRLNLIRALIETLTDEERVDVFSGGPYCRHCGRYTGERFCQCWNDE